MYVYTTRGAGVMDSWGGGASRAGVLMFPSFLADCWLGTSGVHSRSRYEHTHVIRGASVR